jgi:hypothetical protein
MPSKKSVKASQRKSSPKSSKSRSPQTMNNFDVENFQQKIKMTTPLSLNNREETYSSLKNGIVLNIIGGIVAIIINVNALVWLNKLETIKCECSGHWMREYIKYYLYVAIPVFIINLIIYLYAFAANDYSVLLSNNNPVMSIYRGFVGIVSLFGFVNIFIAIIFINKLKEINCECSEDIKREVYWIYNIILASIILLVIIFMLISIPFVIMGMKNR